MSYYRRIHGTGLTSLLIAVVLLANCGDTEAESSAADEPQACESSSECPDNQRCLGGGCLTSDGPACWPQVCGNCVSDTKTCGGNGARCEVPNNSSSHGICITPN